MQTILTWKLRIKESVKDKLKSVIISEDVEENSERTAILALKGTLMLTRAYCLKADEINLY